MVATCAAPLESAVARCSVPCGAISGSSAGDAEHEGRNEDMQLGEPAGIRAPAEKQRSHRFRELADLHHPLALETIGRLASNKYQKRRRQELHQPDHTEIEGAAGHVIDLPADRYRTDLARKARQASRQQKEDQRALSEQRGCARRGKSRHE
jgi:hypothetical protein